MEKKNIPIAAELNQLRCIEDKDEIHRLKKYN